MNLKASHVFPLLLTGFLVAPAAAEDYRIGVVDLIRILEGSPQAAEARARIEKEFVSKEQEVTASQRRLREMEDKLAKDSAVMPEPDRRELERQVISKRREINRLQEEYREDLSYRRNEELSKIQKTIREVIQGIAQDQGYDLILGEGLIYVDSKLDITDAVLKKLEQNRAEEEKRRGREGAAEDGEEAE